MTVPHWLQSRLYAEIDRRVIERAKRERVSITTAAHRELAAMTKQEEASATSAPSSGALLDLAAE